MTRYATTNCIDPPLDPGISDAVMFLREHNFLTFSSCEGGPGHAFGMPTISMEADIDKSLEETRDRLVQLLFAEKFYGFMTLCCYTHDQDYNGKFLPQGRTTPDCVRVSFWRKPPIKIGCNG